MIKILKGDGPKITIRFVGIDAPETSKKMHESGQPFSRKSTMHLASLMLNISMISMGCQPNEYNTSKL
jgi:endonuclease YncB( thermonuclease family)